MNSNPLAAALASLSPGQAQGIIDALAGMPQVMPVVPDGPGGRYRTWNNYYSVVRFQAAVNVAAPTTTLTFATQEQKPFSYRIGDQLGVAGFDNATSGVATDAETNLVKAGETVAGEQLAVMGISLMPSSVSDIGLWKQLCANMSVVISMDGDANRYRLGRPDMIPGSAGTFGSGISPTVLPGLAESVAVDGSFSNGWPTIDNFYPFPQPILWTPSGETDSNLNVVLRLVRQITVVETGRAAASGVAPFTPPTTVGQFGTFVDFMCRLHSVQVAPRSVNR